MTHSRCNGTGAGPSGPCPGCQDCDAYAAIGEKQKPRRFPLQNEVGVFRARDWIGIYGRRCEHCDALPWRSCVRFEKVQPRACIERRPTSKDYVDVAQVREHATRAELEALAKPRRGKPLSDATFALLRGIASRF